MGHVTNQVAAILLLANALGTCARAHRFLLQEEDCPSRNGWDFSNCSSVDYNYLGGANVATATASGVGPSRAVAQPLLASVSPGMTSAMEALPVTGIGFQTGGAQDIENFRENIKAGYLPLPTDVTFEGVVKDYYFDTSSADNEPCNELFCPIYSLASTADPLVVRAFEGPNKASTNEIFLAVGLDSSLQPEDVQRPPLNIVLLVDYSGSMGSPFDRYYYDQFGREQELSAEESTVPKMDVAKDVMNGIIDKLGPNDRLSVVLFSTDACVPLPLTEVRCLDVENLKQDIERDVAATDSTNMAAGFDLAMSQLTGCAECMEAGLAGAENRIMLITDAMPNEGQWSEEALVERLKSSAEQDIHTTVIGVGLDFNSELVEALTKVKGANYYSVHSPGEFQRRLVQEFDYIVNPLVFDLKLQVQGLESAASADDSDAWRILAIYGAPVANISPIQSSGTVADIGTLFPSPETEEGIKGGVILLRIGVPSQLQSSPLQLEASYTDRRGQPHASRLGVELPSQALGEGAFFGSTGVQKAVLLARYTDMLKGWLVDEWKLVQGSDKFLVLPQDWCTVFPRAYCLDVDAAEAYDVRMVRSGCEIGTWVSPGACILPIPPPVIARLNRWERQSVDLEGHVPAGTKQAFVDFQEYMKREMEALNDDTLQQEVVILDTIIAAGR